MAKLITLTEDGPLGSAGISVWVEDDEAVNPYKAAAKKTMAKPAKKTAAPKND